MIFSYPEKLAAGSCLDWAMVVLEVLVGLYGLELARERRRDQSLVQALHHYY